MELFIIGYLRNSCVLLDLNMMLNPYEYFTKDEASCLIAISEQIIIKDENGPCAIYAGVIYYID